jgi:VanZ family protein
VTPPAGLLRGLWIWGPVAAYVFIIFYLSSQSQIPWASPYPDYVGHTLEYAGLAVLVARALNDGLLRPVPPRRLGLSLLLCSSCGAADELYQRLTPDRFSDVLDLLSDAGGAALALAALWLLQRALGRGPGD